MFFRDIKIYSVSVFVRRALAELAVSGQILLFHEKKPTIFFEHLVFEGGSELGGYVRQILSILKVNREE